MKSRCSLHLHRRMLQGLRSSSGYQKIWRKNRKKKIYPRMFEKGKLENAKEQNCFLFEYSTNHNLNVWMNPTAFSRNCGMPLSWELMMGSACPIEWHATNLINTMLTQSVQLKSAHKALTKLQSQIDLGKSWLSQQLQSVCLLILMKSHIVIKCDG